MNIICEILKCDSGNVIYLISCKCCDKQYVGFATGFNERFRIHKTDISTDKFTCGGTNHLPNICRSSASKFEYLQVQLIEKVSVQSFAGKRKIQASTIIYVKPRIK